MKKNALNEIKKAEIKALREKIQEAKKELREFKFDLNLGKLKDKRKVYKKRKDIAQMMTILRQKEMLEELESRVKKQESSEKVVEQRKEKSTKNQVTSTK